MAEKALIIIDMLRDFIEESGTLFVGPTGRAIVPYVAGTVERMRREGAAVVFLTDWHDPDDPEFAFFGRHAVRGSTGAEIIGEIKALPGDYVVRKTNYSGFYKTDLDSVLRQIAPTDVYVVGVCTAICISQTVSDLIDRGYRVHVLAPGVADFDPEQHAYALKHMKIIGASIEGREQAR
jgi:nicotinamidase/pyrazinamidase